MSITRTSKIVFLIVLILLLPFMVLASNVKKDENLILFPTDAWFDKARNSWMVPVHGWIFEPEENSYWRKAVLEAFAAKLNMEPETFQKQIFNKRVRMFLVDNERWKSLPLLAGKKTFKLKRSGADGHFEDIVTISEEDIGPGRKKNWLCFQIAAKQGDPRIFKGYARLLSDKGISVISDIDDTIKESHVTDKKQLLINTFLKEFAPVPGMAEVYKRWERAGYAFHYLSASPWQLYPFLSKFVQKTGFPDGTWYMKLFRAKDLTLFDMFVSSEQFKPPFIISLFERYPERQFILVGDSGESDPEIYADIARKYPDRVIHIFIRKVFNPKDKPARFKKTFKDVPESKWTIFDDPGDLNLLPKFLHLVPTKI
ncbi:DUF2183 domain-containing protein [Desulfobacterales bacterium HSG16]|nr:DUF2183 domain-containing protein [Desulfobacterales bacterium HSG16]